MGNEKGGRQSQINKIVNYAQVTHSKDRMGTNTPEDTRGTMENRDPKESSMSDILNEIKGAHTLNWSPKLTLWRWMLHYCVQTYVRWRTVTEAEDAIAVPNRETRKRQANGGDMVSPRVGSRWVPETDRTEACWGRRAEKHTQKPLQNGTSALAPVGRINVLPDGTLADNGDKLYDHSPLLVKLNKGYKRSGVTTWWLRLEALKDAPFEEVIRDALTQHLDANWGPSTTRGCDWEAMKVVIRGLCMQTTYSVGRQLEKDVRDHKAKLRDKPSNAAAENGRMAAGLTVDTRRLATTGKICL
ncbi:hypothetical protein NDU88_009622 [Pleurodeles waltl]|uniref:Uncharacterized protein n=1 Tax=Pleurodeles waltl TaxID=8319 RepID=A0AAV7QV43_PLEWA|nr:hypothetical protein NDU88_009622 [Pleurodeles waltl]